MPHDAPGLFIRTTDPVRDEYPTLFYHQVHIASVAAEHMGRIRLKYLRLAEEILRLCPPNRSRSLAMTELEYSLMRAIQSLAMNGELSDPRGVLEEDAHG